MPRSATATFFVSLVSLVLASCGKTETRPPAPPQVAPSSVESVPAGALSVDVLPWDATGPTEIVAFYRTHVTCPKCPPKHACEPCPPTGHHFGATRDEQSALLLVDFAGAEPLLVVGQRYLLEGDLVGEPIRVSVAWGVSRGCARAP
jgi:hypothetical protein